MLLVMVYVGRLVRFKEGAYPSMLAFFVAGPIGLLFYSLFPACGPRYVFGQAYPFHPLPLKILSQLALEPTEIPGWRNAMPSACLQDISTLDGFLHDLPLLFGGSIYAWSSAHDASCLEALILPR